MEERAILDAMYEQHLDRMREEMKTGDLIGITKTVYDVMEVLYEMSIIITTPTVEVCQPVARRIMELHLHRP